MDHEKVEVKANMLGKYSFLFGRVLNGAFFYIGWLICMQQAPGEYPYIGPIVILGIILYHLSATHLRCVDSILIVSLGLLGTIVDTLYIQNSLIAYKGGYLLFPGIAPLWITSLWALYAISINHSLAWLEINPAVAAMMGAGGAISSYLVGVKLGAAEFLMPELVCITIIGMVWALVVPLSLWFSRFLKEKFQC